MNLKRLLSASSKQGRQGMITRNLHHLEHMFLIFMRYVAY